MTKRLVGFVCAAAAGCGPRHASFVKVDDVALGRVVIYRNGVAFYERRATVEGGALTVRVPRDRVDDFLKSLTVVDAASRAPLPVAIPREQTDDGANLVMKLQLPTQRTAEVVLTYVTESPAWKPSYRVVVGDHGDVMLEGWAIVDNTSGEDWRNVYVGVGSSSALSFRYDLWSVRQVQRETLASEDRFAIAPPTGGSPYDQTRPPSGGGGGGDVELGDDEIRRPAGHPDDASARRIARPGAAAPSSEDVARLATSETHAESIAITGEGRAPHGRGPAMNAAEIDRGEPELVPPSLRDRAPDSAASRAAAPRVALAPADPRIAGGDQKLAQFARQVLRSDQSIVIEAYAGASAADVMQRARDRGNVVRNRLIDAGVAPARVEVVTKIDTGQPTRVRLIARAAQPEAGAPASGQAIDRDARPVGESHFENRQPITVERGSSAMVAMVHDATEGEVVYLYDAESERGNARFAFRAVRFKNPTDSTLETGPVTVYGHERFIGEGLTEPIPPRASAVVPFALDRQIIVERHDSEDDHIARLASLARGILTAEVQHVRNQRLTITNRLHQRARLFVRHTVAKGWTLTEAPPAFERIGDAHLFEIDLGPGERKDIAIAEATPVERTLDLSADVTLEMMKLWIDSPGASRELREPLRRLLALHRSLVDLAQEQDSLRRRLADYRQRMDDLHGQIVTLQAVRAAGDLSGHLKLKMKEISDRVQKTTIQIVDQEEKIMLARVQFQDALSELTLPDALAAAGPPDHRPSAAAAAGAHPR